MKRASARGRDREWALNNNKTKNPIKNSNNVKYLRHTKSIQMMSRKNRYTQNENRAYLSDQGNGNGNGIGRRVRAMPFLFGTYLSFWLTSNATLKYQLLAHIRLRIPMSIEHLSSHQNMKSIRA